MSTTETGTPTTKPRAERDYFPCCFCKERFATKIDRGVHESKCLRADDPPEREPTQMVVELDPILTVGEIHVMLRRAGLKLVNRGENRPYLLTVEPQSTQSRAAALEFAHAAVSAEAKRIERERERWYDPLPVSGDAVERRRRGEYTVDEVNAAINGHLAEGVE